MLSSILFILFVCLFASVVRADSELVELVVIPPVGSIVGCTAESCPLAGSCSLVSESFGFMSPGELAEFGCPLVRSVSGRALSGAALSARIGKLARLGELMVF